MSDPAKVVTLSEARRERREHENRQQLRAFGIHTRELVLLQRENMMADLAYWHSEAMRWKAMADRMDTLRQIAEIHERASNLLLEVAEQELARLKSV